MSRHRIFSALAASAATALFAAAALCAEEPIRTPSDQMKEAVGKVSKAPATIGKSLQDLTAGAREKLREAFGGGGKSSDPAAKPVDLDVPHKNLEPAPAPRVFKGTERDPFRPMGLRTKAPSRPRERLSPLENFDLSQLKLVAVVWDIKEPRAMVEDPAGLGYVVKVGTAIGNNEGKIKAIRRDGVVIEESYADPYGALKKRDVSMKLLAE